MEELEHKDHIHNLHERVKQPSGYVKENSQQCGRQNRNVKSRSTRMNKIMEDVHKRTIR